MYTYVINYGHTVLVKIKETIYSQNAYQNKSNKIPHNNIHNSYILSPLQKLMQHLSLVRIFRRELEVGYCVNIYVKIRREKLLSVSGPMCVNMFFSIYKSVA